MFSDAGPDVRWIGNEQGIAGDPNWSTVDPAVVPFPGATGRPVRAMLTNGDPNGSAWRPGEADVSIRPGWFHHPAEDARVKTVDQLVRLHFTSVGHNSKLLLNVPPTRSGLLADVDVSRLEVMHEQPANLFAGDLAAKGAARWKATSPRTATLDVDLGRVVSASIADLSEDITRGQLVSKYVVEGRSAAEWFPLSSGTTIGGRKLDRFETASVRYVRVTIADAVDVPRQINLRLF